LPDYATIPELVTMVLLLELPPEVLVRVVSRLAPRDLASLAGVSRALRDLTQEEEVGLTFTVLLYFINSVHRLLHPNL
jgi:hypothetical protein